MTVCVFMSTLSNLYTTFMSCLDHKWLFLFLVQSMVYLVVTEIGREFRIALVISTETSCGPA